MNSNKLFGLILFALGLLLFIRTCMSSTVESEAQINWQDSLKIERNKNGQLIASVEQLKVERALDITKIQGLSHTQKLLADQVAFYKKKARAGHAVSVSLNASGAERTMVDTIIQEVRGDTVYLWPQYKAYINQAYRTGSVECDKDSIRYEVTEKASLVITEVEVGTRRKPATEVKFLVDNPNVTITGASSYRVEHKQRKISFGPYMGIGTSSDLVPRLQFGFGISYKIF